MKKLSLLPLSTHEFSEGLAKLMSDADGGEEDALIIELEGDFARWLQSTARPAGFPKKIGKLLESATWPKQTFDLRKNYPKIYRSLEDSSGIPGDLVLSLLSHLHLIQDLVCRHQFSAARVCQVVAALDTRLRVDFKTMGIILRAIPALPGLSIDSVRKALNADKANAANNFGDSDLSDLALSLQDLAQSLHLHQDSGMALGRLFNPLNDSPKIPYLQVLMCICAVVPFFDHPSEILYEFSPRGALGDLVMDEFPKDLVHTKNAMLNNLKSVYRLSEDWARSKKGLPDQAFALVSIVEGLSSLGYSARKIYAEGIRQAIFRSLEVLTPSPVSIKEVRTLAEIEGILRAMQNQNTATAGILEQRITDFLAAVSLPGENWRVRGLGDSVNASNTASKKLGDLDFQDATALRCEAFEAHGGKLNAAYFNDHLLTLEQTLKHRTLEWQMLGDIGRWSCHVTFIAHEFSGISAKAKVIEGVSCQFTLKTFGEAIDEVLSETAARKTLVDTFNRTVVKSLNKASCAHAVRVRAIEIFGFRSSI